MTDPTLDELNQRLTQLQSVIVEKRREVDTAKQDKFVRRLEDVTVEEKIKMFDENFAYALRELEEIKKHGVSDDDTPHYVWEDIIALVAHPDKRQEFWTWRNSFIF